MELLNAINNKDQNELSQESYNALTLINDLKKEFYSITNLKITDKLLSFLLGYNEKYVNYMKKNFKRNPLFEISLHELSEYKINLKKHLKERSISLIKIIEKYEIINKPKLNNNKIYNFHPNFNLNYFSKINDKERAYWLGFIFADGSISYKRG